MGTVLDTFGRVVAAGSWGTTETGQEWTQETASHSVNASTGRHSHSAVNANLFSFVDTGDTDGTVTVDAMIPVMPTGSAISARAIFRAQDTANFYQALLLIVPTTGAATLQLFRAVGGVGASVSGSVSVGTHAAGDWWRIVFDIRSSALRAKAWNLSHFADPGVWQITATDTSLTTGTNAGVGSRLEPGNTNALPVVVSFDQFSFTPVITAVQQDTWPPRVLVTVNNLFIGDEVEVYRVVGGERTLLRGGTDPGAGDPAFLVMDAELPFGVPVSYTAVVNGAGAVEASTEPVTYTLDGGKVAITDAIGGSAAEAVILAWDEKAHQRQASVFRVGGRNVVVSGDLGMWEGTIELFTETTSSRDNLMSVLADATEGIVQIRQPGGYDGVDSYVAVTGVSERRFSQDGTDQRRVITLDAVEVEGWAPTLEAQGYTLQHISDYFGGTGTLQDVADRFTPGTLLEIAQAEWQS